jgi:hypothetical protein
MTKTQEIMKMARVALPEEIKTEMMLWNMGAGGCDQYIEWHRNMAENELQDVCDMRDFTLHNSYMASDGWGDGVSFLHAVVETRRGELKKIKFSDSQCWYMQGPSGGRGLI